MDLGFKQPQQGVEGSEEDCGRGKRSAGSEERCGTVHDFSELQGISLLQSLLLGSERRSSSLSRLDRLELGLLLG